jgi:hypothetical protein
MAWIERVGLLNFLSDHRNLGASTKTEERTLGVEMAGHRDYQLVVLALLLQCRRHRPAVT